MRGSSSYISISFIIINLVYHFHHYLSSYALMSIIIRITPSPLILSPDIFPIYPISRPPRGRRWWGSSPLSKHQATSKIPIMRQMGLWVSRPIWLPISWLLWMWLMVDGNGKVLFWWRLRWVLRLGIPWSWAGTGARCRTGWVGNMSWE